MRPLRQPCCNASLTLLRRPALFCQVLFVDSDVAAIAVQCTPDLAATQVALLRKLVGRNDTINASGSVVDIMDTVTLPVPIVDRQSKLVCEQAGGAGGRLWGGPDRAADCLWGGPHAACLYAMLLLACCLLPA